MTWKQMTAALVKIGVAPEAGPHGIRLGSTGWRLENGSGIAGNNRTWWLRPIAGMYHPKAPDATAAPIGPIRTNRELRAAVFKKWPNQRARVRFAHLATPPAAQPVKVPG